MPPLPRRLLAGALILVIGLCLLEVASALLFRTLTGLPLDHARLRRERAERIAYLGSKFQAGSAGALYAPHPYLGFVGRSGARPWGMGAPAFNDFGMLSLAGRRYPYRNPEEFVIAVVGGSVAEMFANTAEADLARELAARDARFRARRPVMVSLAIGGYKQPQQLIHLEYALLSGFQVDFVLNLDGFNDLVLAAENVEAGINPIFPSAHHLALLSRGASELDPASVQALADLYAAYRRELWLLETVDRWPLRASAFLNLVARRASDANARAAMRREAALAEELRGGLPPELRGPRLDLGPDRYAVAARLWAESSRLLAGVCRERGIPYLHALQPNQYVEGSKPLTENERRVAIDPQRAWGRSAREGYHELVAAGAELRRSGVDFHDLSGAFRDEARDVYIDTCCHFGPLGNAILARELATAIAAAARRTAR